MANAREHTRQVVRASVEQQRQFARELERDSIYGRILEFEPGLMDPIRPFGPRTRKIDLAMEMRRYVRQQGKQTHLLIICDNASHIRNTMNKYEKILGNKVTRNNQARTLGHYGKTYRFVHTETDRNTLRSRYYTDIIVED